MGSMVFQDLGQAVCLRELLQANYYASKTGI
jgi:hypothetical protein